MKQRLGRILILISLGCGSVGAHYLKARLDQRARVDALRTVRLVRFGAQIDTRFDEYFEETGQKGRYRWSVGDIGWFDRRIPMDLTVTHGDSDQEFLFWVHTGEKAVFAGDEASLALLASIKAWAKAKTPDYLKSKRP